MKWENVHIFISSTFNEWREKKVPSKGRPVYHYRATWDAKARTPLQKELDRQAAVLQVADEVVVKHEADATVNERLGLIDRTYHTENNRLYVSKKYRKDIRDERKTPQPVYILGVCRFGHDSGAALLRDGKLIGAIEEERLNRDKHTRVYFPVESVRYLLRNHNVTWDEIAHLTFTFDYNFFRETPGSISPRDAFFRRVGWVGSTKGEYDTDRLEAFLKQFAASFGSTYVPPVTFVKHHKCHAVSGWRTSPFGDVPTLIFSIDGRGENDSTTVWQTTGGKLTKIAGTEHPDSLGQIYEYTTVYLGYKRFDEGKVMGLAPYGNPLYRQDAAGRAQEEARVKELRDVVNKLLVFEPETGTFSVNREDIDFMHYQLDKPGYSEVFRKKISHLTPPLAQGEGGSRLDPDNAAHRPYFNFAYVVQEKIEEIILEMVKHHRRQTGIEHVIMVGGLALNISTNKRIIHSGTVDASKFYVPAFPGDDGTPIGAALSVAEEEYGLEVTNRIENVSFGKTYSQEETEQTLREFGLKPDRDYVLINGQEELIEAVADSLEQGQTVAWFQGGCELGPRALGNRSLLHLLTDPDGNRKVNEIKGREWWRPSALSILEDSAPEYMRDIVRSPFMTVGFDILPQQRSRIAAGKHPFANDARPQTVSETSCPLFAALLKEMGRRTGVPGLLNTSFNRREPIVETPEEALNTFYYSKGIDVLVIGNIVIKRSDSLLPSVLAASEEPLTASFFAQALKQDSKEAWTQFWAACRDLATRGRSHTLTIWTDKPCTVPLIKELFDRKYAPQIVASLVDMNDSSLSIDCSAQNYRSVVCDVFRRHLPSDKCFTVTERQPFAAVFVNLTSPKYTDAAWTPVGLYNLAGYLKRKFPYIRTDIIDTQIIPSAEQADVALRIAKMKPRMLGISVPPGTREQLRSLLTGFTEQWQKLWGDLATPLIVLGKSLPTFNCESLLAEFPDTLCVIGEGELALHDIIEYVEGVREKGDIRNIGFMDCGKTVYTRRERICDLAEFVHPDYSYAQDIADVGGNVSIEYGRGCPWWKCTFCSVHRFWGGAPSTWLHRPVGDVIRDIRFLHRLGVRRLNFSDEEVLGTTQQDIERLIDFLEQLKKERLEGLKMQFNARVDALIVEDVGLQALIEYELTEMAACGFHTAFLGVEAGSPSQLKRFGKGITPGQSMAAYALMRKHGFDVQSGFIMFDPLVTPAELRDNALFIRESELLPTISAPLNEMRIYAGTPYLKIVRSWEKRNNRALLGCRDDDLMVYEVTDYADVNAGLLYDLCILKYFNSYYEFLYQLKQTVNFSYYGIDTSYLKKHLYHLKELDLALLLEMTALNGDELRGGSAKAILAGKIQERRQLLDRLKADIRANGQTAALHTLIEKTETVKDIYE